MAVQGFPEARWHPSPVYGHGSRPWNWQNIGRSGSSDIRQVIAHTAESGSAQSALNSLSNVPLDRGLDSAHYLVADDVVYQLVDDRNQAWHGGNANPYSIGIETVGRADDPSTWTPGVIRNWGRLAGWLSWAYQIPLVYIDGALGQPAAPIPDRAFIAHGALSSTRYDPGVYFPWGEIRQAAVQYLDTTEPALLQAGLDPNPQVQAELQPHPQWEGDVADEPPAAESRQAKVPGGGPVIALLLVAAGLALWVSR